jgi:Arc/MetJ family transcription regulator
MEVITMGRTNVVLNDTLVEECRKMTGIKTKRALIEYALQETLRHGRQRRLLELKGSVKWEGDLAAWREARP